MKKTLKIGTGVQFTDEYVQWCSENAELIHGYYSHMKDQDDILSYSVDYLSHLKGLQIFGVVIGYNDEHIDDELFGYLVWYGNELGEDTTYISPEYLKEIK